MGYYVNAASTASIGIVFPIICTIAVCLRFLVRWQRKAGYGPDDWASVVALILTIAGGVMLDVGVAYQLIAPFGEPLSDAKQSLLFKLEYAFMVLSVVNIGAIRLAFVLLFRRIFRGTLFSIVNWTLIGIIIGWTIAFFLALLLQCGSHFSAVFQTQETYGQYCSTSFDIMAAMGVTDVVIDLAILVLPIGPIKQLNMDTKRKLGLIAIFSLGIFSVGAGVTRMIFLMEIVAYKNHSSNNLFGLGPKSTPISLFPAGLWWTYIEIGVSCFKTVEEFTVIVDIEMFVGISIVR